MAASTLWTPMKVIQFPTYLMTKSISYGVNKSEQTPIMVLSITPLLLSSSLRVWKVVILPYCADVLPTSSVTTLLVVKSFNLID